MSENLCNENRKLLAWSVNRMTNERKHLVALFVFNYLMFLFMAAQGLILKIYLAKFESSKAHDRFAAGPGDVIQDCTDHIQSLTHLTNTN